MNFLFLDRERAMVHCSRRYLTKLKERVGVDVYGARMPSTCEVNFEHPST